MTIQSLIQSHQSRHSSSHSQDTCVVHRYIALQRDSRFEAVYAKYLKMFDEVGLVNDTLPLMHFTSAGYPSKFGSW